MHTSTRNRRLWKAREGFAGRTAAENDNRGTDHGTAAPHFLMGGKINGGLYGRHPSLIKLVDGDLSYTMDYRSVYDWILGSWFQIGSGDDFFESTD